jgi:SAM-dependent methyltransferase
MLVHLEPIAPERPPEVNDRKWPQFADHVARYAFAAGYAKGCRVLDAGCGPGYGSMILAAAGAVSVVGVDYDAKTVAQAQSNHKHPALTFVVDDCEVFAHVSGPFDLICSFENIEHLRQPERFLAAAARALTPDGLLIVSTPDRAGTAPFVNGKPANPHHFHEWYATEFLGLLSPHFGQCEVRTQVKSFAVDRRRQGVEALVAHLKRNPIARLRGVASVLIRKQSYWQSIRDIATPSVADYPVVDAAVAPFFGLPWCCVATCRMPIRT